MLKADRCALEEMVIVFLGLIACWAPVVKAVLMLVEALSCWEQAVAEFEGKGVLFKAALGYDSRQ
jgi:hypothetical protein